MKKIVDFALKAPGSLAIAVGVLLLIASFIFVSYSYNAEEKVLGVSETVPKEKKKLKKDEKNISITPTIFLQQITSSSSGNINTTSPMPTSKPNQASPTPSNGNQNQQYSELGHLPILGNSQAKVTIVEYSDFQCPFCRSFEGTLGQIKSEYINSGKVRFVYRHLPLSFHSNAQKAAEASECANEQGKFWDYHDRLFSNQDNWANLSSSEAINTFVEYAGQSGMNKESFKQCVESGKFAGNVQSDVSSANMKGISATPSFYINSQQLVGSQPYEAFKTVIDQELAK